MHSKWIYFTVPLHLHIDISGFVLEKYSDKQIRQEISPIYSLSIIDDDIFVKFLSKVALLFFIILIIFEIWGTY